MSDAIADVEKVWVLDDPRAGTSAQALGIAERLGVGFRRIPLSWNWMAHVAALSRRGSLIGLAAPPHGTEETELRWSAAESLVAAREIRPSLVISSGSRSAAVALWLKARFDCAIVHCMKPGIGGLFRQRAYDLMVIPEHDMPAPSANILSTLGAPHRVSPLVLRQAGEQWRERLGHLPHPRIALLAGGAREHPLIGNGLTPSAANALGRQVARMAKNAGGSVMATTSRRTGDEATEALAAGLGSAMHLIYRWGEPSENPYLGYLATADAIVVTSDSVSMISEACATSASVFVALPELAGTKHRRLIDTLTQAGQVRRLGRSLVRWDRTPLDEAGRVAHEVLRRFPLD